jgi:heme/copper-type cytochrome/quinol oxidase subunit 2
LQAPRPKTVLQAAAATLGGVALLPAQASAAGVLPPDPASGNAGSMRTIYVIMLVFGVLVTLGVLAAIVRSVRGSRSEAEPVRRTSGTAAIQRKVGIGLGTVATILFIVGVIFTESASDVDASESGAEPIYIKVDGQQWLWRYQYPGERGSGQDAEYSANTPYSYYELVVPVDTPIVLQISSIDVVHRWWVPQLAPAAQAVPESVSEVSFTADEVGTYEGRSTEFSGPGYTAMRTAVEVVEPEEYETFLEERRTEIQEARTAVQEAVEDGTAPGVELEEIAP